MPFTDFAAAQRIAEMREQRGLSQEGLASAISRHARDQGWLKEGGIGKVDADTIRRIERDGHCPMERVRLVISLYFEVPIREIWVPTNRQVVPRKKPAPRRREAVLA